MLTVGAVLFVWFSWGLLRALRLVHAAAWRVRLEPLSSAPRALAAVLAAPVVLAALTAAAGWARASVGGIGGLVVTLAVSLGFGALWLLVSMRLPSVAGTALFYLFLIGRGVVWAAELNTVTWELRHPERAS